MSSYSFVIGAKAVRGLARKRGCSPSGRKGAEGFDLGAGPYNCVNCSNILPPDSANDLSAIPHRCARFSNPISGEPGIIYLT